MRLPDRQPARALISVGWGLTIVLLCSTIGRGMATAAGWPRWAAWLTAAALAIVIVNVVTARPRPRRPRRGRRRRPRGGAPS